MDFAFTRLVGNEGERMDCTVHALAAATGIAYAQVHAALAAKGRKNGQPFPMPRAWEGGYFENFRVQTIAFDEYTLGRFLRTEGKSGRYIVRMMYPKRMVGHVFAVVDGVAYDTAPTKRGAYQRLCQIWKLTER